MKRFWISDIHFGHYNVIEYSNRPFMCKIDGNKITFNEKKLVTFNFKNNQALIGDNVVKEDIYSNKIQDFLENQRKWHSVKIMEEKIISNWNKTVSKDDLVYYVGDFAFCGTIRMKAILSKLNGKKILIRGNHDRSASKMKEVGFSEVYESLEIEIGGKKVLMSHYPYISSDLNDIAQRRPNIMKISKNGEELPLPKEKLSYDNLKEYLIANGNKIFSKNTDDGEKAFRTLKRAIKKFIGTKLVNEGKPLIHGHTHSEDKIKGNMINVSAEAWDYTPASEGEILSLLSK